MAAAIAGIAVRADADVQVIARDGEKAANLAAKVGANVKHGAIGDPLFGDIVVLAVPYQTVSDVIDAYASQLADKTLVEISNPVDYVTFDGLVVPPDSSAAAQLAAQVPEATVIKAFNINFAETLKTGMNGPNITTVVLAGNDRSAKRALGQLVEAAGMRVIDAGSLSRARELEALGYLQVALASHEKTSWKSGFALLP
jgi:predicted dinucleotide-binding enzyme